MKLRWTIALIVVNALLLWGIFSQFTYSTTERSFDRQVRSFLPLSGGDWDSLAVSSSAGAWRATRDRWGRWWLRSPYEWPAKAESIARMNGYLATLQIDSAFATAELSRVGQSLRSYGLDNPRVVLEVGSGSRSLSFKVGNTSPLGNKVYVLSPDEKEVWVVDAGLNEYLAFSSTVLRQGGFFPFNLVELEAVEVTQGENTTRFERKSGSSSWQLKVGELALGLRAGAWESWEGDLSAVTPSETQVDQTAQIALKNPYARLVFQTLYGRRSLLVGDLTADAQHRWAQWEGGRGAFAIPLESLSLLQPDSFLDNRPVALQPEEITSLDWTLGESVLSLRRLEGGQWVIASAENTSADTFAVRELLERLCAIQATPSLQKELVEPAAEKLRLQTTTQTIEVYIDRTLSEIRSARTAGRILYRGGLWPQLPAALSLADLRLLPQTIDSLQSFSFSALASAQPQNYASDTPQAQALLALLKNKAQAQSWTKLPADLGEANYRLTVALPDRTITFEFWLIDGNFIGRVNGRGFYLLPEWKDFLYNLLKV